MSKFASNTLVTRLAILALAAWFGGLSCLAGCEVEVWAAAIATPATGSTEAEGLHRGGPNRPTPDPSDTHKSESKCCPLSSIPPAAGKQVPSKQFFTVIALLHPSAASAVAADSHDLAAPPDTDDSGTYLRWHVLRI